ncbi:MAG: PEP-CTERM-box response regulator transcription factor [bacterium]
MTESPANTNKHPEIEKPRLLIVEDDPGISNQLRWGLSNDYDISTACDLETTLTFLKKEVPSVVTLDLGLPPRPDDGVIGLQLLGEILKLDPLTKVIVITGNTEKENALKAVHMGAYDFYYKPIDMDELKIILSRAFHIKDLERENKKLQKRLESDIRFENLIGQSTGMQEVFSSIKKVASSNIPVLVIGESGTGKELVSKSIHNRSGRKKNPFVAINCGAIPETLLESELFGHEKGSFTGAYAQQKGKVEYADGGTLFLDEIGELPLTLQVKLLRFLQEHTIERVGGRESLSVDARIIAATQKDLLKATRNGSFREDLYYRLSVVTINIPPLRERDDDILLIAKYYFSRFNNELKRNFKGFSDDAIASILAYKWPGNIRELENKIKRAVIMGEGSWITPESLDLESCAMPSPKKLSLRDARERAEISIIQHALNRHNGNITRAAAEIGVSRPTLHDLMRKHGIMIDK